MKSVQERRLWRSVDNGCLLQDIGSLRCRISEQPFRGVCAVNEVLTNAQRINHDAVFFMIHKSRHNAGVKSLAGDCRTAAITGREPQSRLFGP